MRSTDRRVSPIFVSAGLTLGLIALLSASSHAQVADTHVDLGELTATAARQPVSSPWLQARIAEVVSQLDARCYQPALARRGGQIGELRVRAGLSRNGRLTGVTVTRTAGGTLTPLLAACVRGAFVHARLDPAPLPVTPRDPREPGAFANGPPQGPPDVRYPIRVSFHLALSAPPAPPAETPEPEPRRNPGTAACGPNPAGCVSTGCRRGMHCETNVGCRPSGCGCDPDRGTWTCTADCGGGTCVPDGASAGDPMGL